MALVAAWPLTGDGVHAAEGEVVVRTVETGQVAGAIESFNLTEGLVLTTRDGKKLELPAADVVQLDTNLPRLKADPESFRWIMIGGDAVYARLVEGDDRTLTLRHDDAGDFDVPLTRLRAMIMPSVAAASTQPAAAPATRPATRDDEVLLRNGDRLRGLIGRIEPGGLTLETDDGETIVRFGVLKAAWLAQPAPTTTRPAGPVPLRARLTLRDGSTLTVSDLHWRRDGLTVQVDRGGQRVTRRLPSDRVLQVAVVGGRWVWLDQVSPRLAAHTPLLGVAWPHRVNRNVLGKTIRVGGRAFERGIGVHSQSRLVYELDGRCRRFVTGYGLDDASGSLADVEVVVLLDGKRVHHAPSVRFDGRVHRASIDVRGAKELELRVDFGKDGDVQDRFDWIESALVRQ